MMQAWARERAGDLLERLEKEIRNTTESRDPEAVHDLRVTIRRLNRCLRVFSDFYPRRVRRKARRRLSHLMDLAAAVRDRDITLELMAKARVGASRAGAAPLRRDRDLAARALLAEAESWRDRGFAARWRKDLGL